MKIFGKYMLPKKYIAFFTIIPILAFTGLVQMPCPVCDGTGYVTGAPGMENVTIIDVDYAQRFVNRDMNMCGMYVMYLYDITLSVVNSGLEDTWGYVKLTLVDLLEGKVVDDQFVILEIPGNTSLDVNFTIWFQSLEDLRLLRDSVGAQIILDEVEDLTCQGTGKLPLNSWFVARGLKDSLIELGREQVYYVPPPVFDIDDEQW